MATQIIPFLDHFKLIIDPDHDSQNIIQDGLNSISVLSSIAKDCTDLVNTIREGGQPTEQALIQIGYSASIVSGLAISASGLLILEVKLR